MKDIASNTSYFCSACCRSRGDSGCQALDRSNTIPSLNDILKTIAATFGGILTR